MALARHHWDNLFSAGLAKDFEFQPMPPEYGLTLQNAVYGSNGRLETRQGFAAYSSAWSSGTPIQIFEYLDASGTSILIASTASDLFDVTTGAKTSRKGALSPSAGDWKFLNFNGKVLGWQASHTPIVKTGSGNWAAISASSGTLPDGNAACAAFGRVWAVDDDKQTIRYCALLDETKWATADGGGSIDMRQVWTQGMDEVIAIEAFGSNLVVFGRRHVIIWTDGSGSQLGLSPTNMYVTDTIDGIGAVNRNAVLVVGEIDVVFWSGAGIRSLRRSVQERAAPNSDISPKNRFYISTGAGTSTYGSIRMAYYPKNGFVAVYAPGVTSILVFDIRQFADGTSSEARMTTWFLTATALGTSRDGDLFLGQTDALGKYTGYRDFTVAYTMTLETGFIDIRGEPKQEQALKSIRVNATSGFTSMSYSLDFAFDTDTTVSEEVDELLASYQSRDRFPLAGSASYFQLQLAKSTTVQAATAVNGATLYTKPMRMM